MINQIITARESMKIFQSKSNYQQVMNMTRSVTSFRSGFSSHFFSSNYSLLPPKKTENLLNEKNTFPDVLNFCSDNIALEIRHTKRIQIFEFEAWMRYEQVNHVPAMPLLK